MNAKQKEPIATLFARIPQRLKMRLNLSAKTHGVSEAKEIARLIDDCLESKLSAHLRRVMVERERDIYKVRLDTLERHQHMLEDLLLAYIREEGAGAVPSIVAFGEKNNSDEGAAITLPARNRSQISGSATRAGAVIRN